jgi:rhodanese-related sulfurtransferase
LSRLGYEGVKMLSESAQQKDAVLYVLCHHGSRSMQVTGWLVKQGWTKVFNVDGGIDEYARKIDRSVGLY